MAGSLVLWSPKRSAPSETSSTMISGIKSWRNVSHALRVHPVPSGVVFAATVVPDETGAHVGAKFPPACAQLVNLETRSDSILSDWCIDCVSSRRETGTAL